MESEETFHCDGSVFGSVETVHEGVDACARERVRGVADGEDGGDL